VGPNQVDKTTRAEERTGDAKTSASSAAHAADRANSEADRAKGKAEEVGREADLLRRQAGELAQENSAMESRLIKADQDLEEERKKRVELAASLLPRVFSDQSGAIARLAPFPPMSAVFEFIDEHEPRAIAEQINFVLKNLRWPTSRKLANEAFIKEGITISVGQDMRSMIPPGTPPGKQSEYFRIFIGEESVGEAVARALQESIKRCGIDAEIGAGAPLPPTTLLIEVGVKPNHALEATLKELGPAPSPTPLGSIGIKMWGNRTPIPEENPTPGKNRQQ